MRACRFVLPGLAALVAGLLLVGCGGDDSGGDSPFGPAAGRSSSPTTATPAGSSATARASAGTSPAAANTLVDGVWKVVAGEVTTGRGSEGYTKVTWDFALENASKTLQRAAPAEVDLELRAATGERYSMTAERDLPLPRNVTIPPGYRVTYTAEGEFATNQGSAGIYFSSARMSQVQLVAAANGGRRYAMPSETQPAKPAAGLELPSSTPNVKARIADFSVYYFKKQPYVETPTYKGRVGNDVSNGYMKVSAGLVLENNSGQSAFVRPSLWVVDDLGVYAQMSWTLSAPPGTTKTGLATAELDPGAAKKGRIDLIVMAEGQSDVQIYSIDVAAAEQNFTAVMDGLVAYQTACQYQAMLVDTIGVTGPTTATATGMGFFRSGSSGETYYLTRQSGKWVVTQVESPAKCR